jgi:hypothetical protein
LVVRSALRFLLLHIQTGASRSSRVSSRSYEQRTSSVRTTREQRTRNRTSSLRAERTNNARTRTNNEPGISYSSAHASTSIKHQTGRTGPCTGRPLEAKLNFFRIISLIEHSNFDMNMNFKTQPGFGPFSTHHHPSRVFLLSSST